VDKINELLQENFGITVDQMDTVEARQALGDFYDRVQSAIQLEDPTIIEFILEEIKVAQGTAGGAGLVQEDEVQNIVIDTIEEIAKQNPDYDLSGFSLSERGYYVLDEEGNLTKVKIPSAFPDGFASLYNISLQPELVAGLQQDLIRAGVVEPDYFDDEDEFGQKTANALSVVLEYADANIFIDKNSEQGKKLIQQYGDGHYGFTQKQSDEIIFARAVLDLAIQKLGDDVRLQEEAQEKLADEAAVQAIASQYTIPTYEEMDDTIDEVFGQLVTREATAKEKDRYSTALAGQYSSRFKQLLALEKAVRTNNIFKDVPAIQGPDDMLVTPTTQELRTDIFQITDPEATVGRQIEKDLEGEMSAIEKGNAARRQQAALIQAMIGQL
tara:strand:- start:106 stop:1257 length:1152 start_codon:yes stop_codon:yes gene_type:complete